MLASQKISAVKKSQNNKKQRRGMNDTSMISFQPGPWLRPCRNSNKICKIVITMMAVIMVIPVIILIAMITMIKLITLIKGKMGVRIPVWSACSPVLDWNPCGKIILEPLVEEGGGGRIMPLVATI